MKKIIIVLCLALVVAGIVSAQVARGGTLYVSVRSLELKSSTGFFASNRGTINHGDQVTVLQVSGRFVEVRYVRSPFTTGWAPAASFSARQVVAGATGTATASEVALAGKGFNQDVEQSFRNQNRNLNYADVDRVEAIRINEAELRRFLEEGRLAMGDN